MNLSVSKQKFQNMFYPIDCFEGDWQFYKGSRSTAATPRLF